ncbi:MAG: hypothetical protein EOO65_02595, partial [Methanosarcinales archaeon]
MQTTLAPQVRIMDSWYHQERLRVNTSTQTRRCAILTPARLALSLCCSHAQYLLGIPRRKGSRLQQRSQGYATTMSPSILHPVMLCATAGCCTSRVSQVSIWMACTRLGSCTRRLQADVDATNGVVHVIGSVLMPPAESIVTAAQADTSFTLLVQAVVKCGLASALAGPGPFTVFAPTNSAFRAAGFDSTAIANADAATVTA